MTRSFSFESTTAVGAALCLAVAAPAWAETSRMLPDADADLVEEASQVAMEYSKTFETTEWVNPDTGNRGSITPTENYRTSDGTFCREFHQTVVIRGEEVEAYGTACRQPDGVWEIARRTPEEELGLLPEPEEPVEVAQPAPEVVYRDRVVYVRDADPWYPWVYTKRPRIGFGITDTWRLHRGEYSKHRHRVHHHRQHGRHGAHHRHGSYQPRW